MIQITKYDLTTGLITGSATCDPALATKQLGKNEGYIVGLHDHREFMVKDGVAVPRDDADQFAYDEKYAAMIAMRNAMLKASDWTQLPDAPVDKDAWGKYRQLLRDLPNNIKDIENIEWPISP